ncbi:MAG: 30S ribosomal protein S2 [Patescibacteria group bacterium]
MTEYSLQEMLQKGVHFGHQKKSWHPKMAQYIYTTRAGVHIFDLEKTAQKLSEAADFVRSVASSGGKILFVSTKRQAQAIVRKAAASVNMPFATISWIGGTLTNFDHIIKQVHLLKDLRKKRAGGELAKYTKRERLQFDEQIASLEKTVGGIETLESLPQALFIVDLKKEKTALREAKKKKIPVVAMVDSNCNPDLVDYAIPSNDDATKSIEYIVNAVTTAIADTVKKPVQTEEPKPAPAQPADKVQKGN